MTDVKAALVEAEWDEGKSVGISFSSWLDLFFNSKDRVVCAPGRGHPLFLSLSLSLSHLTSSLPSLSLLFPPDAAFSALRKRGLAAAAKKASRRAAEGWVSVALSAPPGCSSPPSSSAALAEVNCETDFAARNELLTSLASDAARAALESVSVSGSSDAVEASSVPALASLCADGAAAAAAVVRENVVVRRVASLSTSGGGGGVIGSYVHSPITAGASVGRMAGLVALEPLEGAEASEKGSNREGPAALANKLAMHVVAARPLSLDRMSLPPGLVESERAIAAAQAAASGKPAAIVERIVDGRLGKWYEEVCLLEQKLVMDDSVTVAAAAKKEGMRVAGFARLQVGEGLELEARGSSGEDFKSEVEKLAGGVH